MINLGQMGFNLIENNDTRNALDKPIATLTAKKVSYLNLLKLVKFLKISPSGCSRHFLAFQNKFK